MAHLADRLAKFKWPRSIDFVEERPREPTGKLLKRQLRDTYWEGRERAIRGAAWSSPVAGRPAPPHQRRPTNDRTGIHTAQETQPTRRTDTTHARTGTPQT